MSEHAHTTSTIPPAAMPEEYKKPNGQLAYAGDLTALVDHVVDRDEIAHARKCLVKIRETIAGKHDRQISAGVPETGHHAMHCLQLGAVDSLAGMAIAAIDAGTEN